MMCLHSALALKAGIITCVSRASCLELHKYKIKRKKIPKQRRQLEKTNEIHAGGPTTTAVGVREALLTLVPSRLMIRYTLRVLS